MYPQHSQIVTKCLNGFLATQPLKAHDIVWPWYWAGVYSQRAKTGRKREDTVYLFSEWRVLEVRTGFHTETMARIHPAALSLLLSLPILRLSICPWAETHGTSCSTQHTSQKFTSCSSALLLHTDPIPRTCINGPSYAQMAGGHTNRQASASPLYRNAALPLCLSYTLMQSSKFQTVHSRQKCSAIILLFPPAQIWSDSGNTLCYFNGVRQRKGGCRFLFKLVNEKE